MPINSQFVVRNLLTVDDRVAGSLLAQQHGLNGPQYSDSSADVVVSACNVASAGSAVESLLGVHDKTQGWEAIPRCASEQQCATYQPGPWK
jgi:hypothetical protein